MVRAFEWLDKAEALVFSEEARSRDLASFYIFLAVQECVDLTAHWIAEAGWGCPDDAGSAFGLLAAHRGTGREVAEDLRDAVALRDRISHDYASVDHAMIQHEFPKLAAALRRFLAQVSAEAGL